MSFVPVVRKHYCALGIAVVTSHKTPLGLPKANWVIITDYYNMTKKDKDNSVYFGINLVVFLVIKAAKKRLDVYNWRRRRDSNPR
jgi:hypothetical protein